MTYFKNYEFLIYIVLVVFIPLVFLIFYSSYRKRSIRKIMKDDRTRELLVSVSYLKVSIKESILALALLVSVFVLLRPSWGDVTKKIDREGSDVLIAVDVSRSMLARDVSPNRLERARGAIRWITESLKGDRIGLIAFAGDAFLMCPLTNDIDAFLMFLKSLGPGTVNLQGTDFGKMLEESKKVFSRKRMTSKMLIVVSDGEDHEDKYSDLIPFFKENGVSVYTLGIGKLKGDFIPTGNDNSTGDVFYRDLDGKIIQTKSNRGLLKRLSDSTGGAYINISSSYSGMDKVISEIEKQQENYFGSKIVTEKEERTEIFILILIVLLMAELIMGETKKITRSKKVEN